MIHELKMHKCITKEGIELLLTEKSEDNFLIQLKDYLFEHRLDIPYILKMLTDESIKEYGGDMMYAKFNKSLVVIYNYYHEDPERYEIEINRTDLIEIFKAWLELNKLMEPHSGIKEIILQRDEEHITMIGCYEDGFEYRRTFNYKVK